MPTPSNPPIGGVTWMDAIDGSIEVYAGSLKAILDGLAACRTVATAHMVANGIMSSDAEIADTGRWYPLSGTIRAYHAIEEEAGRGALFDVGASVPKNAQFPETIADIDAAMKANDIAYHMNHRKAGVVMFDPATGAMVEGIGHYRYSRSGSEQTITMVCDGPYPCSFDYGLLTALAQRFETGAAVAHDGEACRASGNADCTYVITW